MVALLAISDRLQKLHDAVLETNAQSIYWSDLHVVKARCQAHQASVSTDTLALSQARRAAVTGRRRRTSVKPTSRSN